MMLPFRFLLCWTILCCIHPLKAQETGLESPQYYHLGQVKINGDLLANIPLTTVRIFGEPVSVGVEHHLCVGDYQYAKSVFWLRPFVSSLSHKGQGTLIWSTPGGMQVTLTRTLDPGLRQLRQETERLADVVLADGGNFSGENCIAFSSRDGARCLIRTRKNWIYEYCDGALKKISLKKNESVIVHSVGERITEFSGRDLLLSATTGDSGETREVRAADEKFVLYYDSGDLVKIIRRDAVTVATMRYDREGIISEIDSPACKARVSWAKRSLVSYGSSYLSALPIVLRSFNEDTYECKFEANGANISIFRKGERFGFMSVEWDSSGVTTLRGLYDN